MNPIFFPCAQITGDTVLTLVALAAGIAVAIVYLVRKPQIAGIQTEVEAHSLQIRSIQESHRLEREAWESRLTNAEKLIDGYRDKLRICQDLNAEMGARVRALEETIEQDHDHPLP